MRKIYSAHLLSGIAAATVLIIGGVASAQSVAFPNEIGVGAQGTEVTSLQTWLENNGYYSGPITGYYGTLTMGGVEAFQTASSISATGYVGPLTLAALNARTSGSGTVGSSNPTLLAQLQTELNSLLAQIQALENGTTVTTTTAPSGAVLSLQGNENANVSANLSASGTGPYMYTISASPINGSITSFNTSTGAFTYVPKANFTGSDSFTYTVGNGSGTSAPVTVNINVEPSTNPTTAGAPAGQSLSFATSNGAALNGMLTASGTGPFVYEVATKPTSGTILNFSSSTGAFTYIPNSGYNGNDSFTYVVGNSTATSSAYTVNITD